MLLRGLTLTTISDHCAYMAQHDRAYAEWAWRSQYPAIVPWLFAPARARLLALQSTRMLGNRSTPAASVGTTQEK